MSDAQDDPGSRALRTPSPTKRARVDDGDREDDEETPRGRTYQEGAGFGDPIILSPSKSAVDFMRTTKSVTSTASSSSTRDTSPSKGRSKRIQLLHTVPPFAMGIQKETVPALFARD